VVPEILSWHKNPNGVDGPGFTFGLLPVDGVEVLLGERVLRAKNLPHGFPAFKSPPDGFVLVGSPGQFLCIGGLHKNPSLYYTTPASMAISSDGSCLPYSIVEPTACGLSGGGS